MICLINKDKICGKSMINQSDIDCFTGPLKDILEKELKSGNKITETFRGDWPYKDVVGVCLANPFSKPAMKDIDGIDFHNVNDYHYWKADYYDHKNNLILICNFSSTEDLKWEY